MRQFIKISILFSLLLLGYSAKAQNWSLIMEMVVTEDGKKRAGAEINVYRDGKFVEKVLTDGKGMADIPMKPGGVYTVEIGGNDGLIKKKLEINTNGVPPEDIQGETYFPAEVDVFKKIDGLDYNILNKPIGKIQYDPSIAGFDADRGYTKEMKSKLEQLEEDYLEKKEQEAQNEAQKQKQYDEAIKVADKAFKEEKWEDAETYYKKAAELMPIETYPTFQLAELETKLIKIRETNKKYDDAIGKADAALASKNYETAIAEFKRASGYKPDEEYPQTKIKEVQTLLAKQAKVEQDYLTAIERGDNALKASDLNTAKTSFEEAASLKPEESYPKNKLAEINAELEKRNAKEQEYQDAIKSADEALAAKDYELAKSSYQKALGLKPAEKYPADQIAKVDELLAAEVKKQQDYLAAIQKGDDALTANDFATAKAAFQEAIKIKSDEEYPKNKIKEIDELLAKQEAKEQEYQNKIKEADQALASQSYENAKTLFQEASSLKPTETYPLDKIKEIDTLLAEQAKKDENYNAAIQKGDQALAAEDFEAAKTAFNEAIAIKPDEQYPKDKLSEIEGIVVKMQESEAAYQKAIQNGDDALTNEDFENAKKFYQEALSLKAEEQYPKDKLQEIDAKQKALAEADAKYKAAIEAADAAFSSKDYETAKKEYETALSIKGEEKYPQDKLGEISKLMAEVAEQNAAYDAAIQKGDELLANTDLEGAKSDYEEALKIKEEQYPKDKIADIEKQIAEQAEKEASYTAAIEKADALFDKESWAEAQTAYEEALAIKEDSYPQGRIDEIKTKLEQLAAEEEAAAKLEADYQAAIAEGDQFTNDKKYAEAIVAFQKAVELKADEAYPKDKIKELETLQKQLAEEAEEKAKQERLQAQYDSLINIADGQLAANELENARKSYQEALSLKSEESYPKEKIEEINSTLADAEEQEKAYAEAIKEADKLFDKEELEAAKAKYVEASSIKSEEQYPKDKIAEIDAKLEALAAEQEEIRLKEEAQAEKDAQYQALIAEADQLLGESKLDEAQAKYEEALTVKDEQYPKDQLAAIETPRQELAAAAQEEAAAEEQAKLDAQYQALIAEADQLLGESKLDEAQAKYEEALTVKDEQYPKDQLAAIEEQRASIALKTAEKEKAQKEAKYQALIAEGDALLADNDLEGAKDKYEEALGVLENPYPAQQIAEIEKRLQALAEKQALEAKAAQKEANYQNAIAEGDQALANKNYDVAIAAYQKALGIKAEEEYPTTKIQEIEQLKLAQAEQNEFLQRKYEAAMTEGQTLFSEGDYKGAIRAYERAKTLKPNETLPQDKIKEAELAIANAKAKEEEIKLQQQREAENEMAYQTAIANADKLYQEKNYNDAENEYRLALSLKPSKTYPQEQMDKITAYFKAKAEAQSKAKQDAIQYEQFINEGDDAFKKENYLKAKSKYQAALGIKKESYPKEQLVIIEQNLEEQRKRKAEALKKMDEPIQIQTGPKATIDGDAEARIDALYKEMWSKKNSNKNKTLTEKQKVLEELKNKEREEEEKRRLEAQSKIEEISVSLKKQTEEVDELNLKNYETVKVKEKAISEEEKENRNEAKRDREDVMAEKEDFLANQEKNNQERNLQLVDGKKELVENENEEIKISREYRYSKQDERIGEEQNKVVEIDKDIRTFNQEKAENRGEQHTKMLNEKSERYVETQKEYVEGGNERTEEENENIEEFREELIEEQQQKQANSFKHGQEVVDEQKQAVPEYEKELVNDADRRIGEQQENINDQAQLDQQMKNERKDNYSENQEKIEKIQVDLKEETESLNAESEKRRQENSEKEYYSGEDKPRQDPESAEYPQGVTEKIIENSNGSTTIRRIVVEGTQTDIYEKTLYSWGGIFYTKNGANITKEIWDEESR